MTKRKDPRFWKKNGRPELYTEELANRVLELTPIHCQSIVLKRVGISRDTFEKWIKTKPDFAGKYNEKLADWYYKLPTSILTLIDDTVVLTTADVTKLKLKIDNLHWYHSKFLPKSQLIKLRGSIQARKDQIVNGVSEETIPLEFAKDYMDMISAENRIEENGFIKQMLTAWEDKTNGTKKR